MKGKRNLLIGIILGALIGWGIAFFCSPLSFKRFSFLLGLIAGFAFASAGVALYVTKYAKNANSSSRLLGLLTFVLIVLAGIVSGFLLIKQQQTFDAQVVYQEKSISRQSALVESVRRGNLVVLMKNILDKVDEELVDNEGQLLSEATIERITGLAHSFQPYSYLEGDSISENKYSPERGQLLLALSKIGMASSSFQQIKSNASFATADLSGADLWAANLQGSDLRATNFQGANLRKVDLQQAVMSDAHLREADFGEADLREVDFRRANLSWANLRETQLIGANLSGALMAQAKLSGVDLSGVDLKWADLSGVFLDEANLAGIALSGTVLRRANLQAANLSKTDMRWTNLKEANLRGANLSQAKFRRANLSRADLTGTDLSGANFSVANLQDVELHQAIIDVENWLEQLKEWEVVGAESIQKKYKIVADNSEEGKYRLEKIGAIAK